MRNTGTIYSGAEKKPVVSPELAGLLPPLTEVQYASLEESILQNGCYSPIIVNENLEIVDGHNRQAICEKHGIPYQIMVFHFDDALEAMKWAVETQKARRNLTAWELGKIALKLKPEVEARAKANQSAAGGDKSTGNDVPSADSDEESDGALCTNWSKVLPEEVDTRQELADAVGVGRSTMGRIMRIDEEAPQAVKDALDNREISVNAGYEITRELQEVPEENREEAAEVALAMRKAQKELQKSDEEIARKTKISQNFSKIYRALIHLKATREDVDCWVECCRMTPAEIQNNLDETRDFIEKFTRIAELLEAKLSPERTSDEDDEAKPSPERESDEDDEVKPSPERESGEDGETEVAGGADE